VIETETLGISCWW